LWDGEHPSNPKYQNYERKEEIEENLMLQSQIDLFINRLNENPEFKKAFRANMH